MPNSAERGDGIVMVNRASQIRRTLPLVLALYLHACGSPGAVPPTQLAQLDATPDTLSMADSAVLADDMAVTGDVSILADGNAGDLSDDAGLQADGTDNGDTAQSDDAGFAPDAGVPDVDAESDGYCDEVGACEDGVACTLDKCDAATGCVHLFLEGQVCSDGNACTTDDLCTVGACGGTKLNCDDANTCTQDFCDPKSGCDSTLAGGACDDGDQCTAGDTCKTGSCTGGSPAVCDDGLPCTKDMCDSKAGCAGVPWPEGTPCDDGAPCTVGSACDGANSCLLGKSKLWSLEYGGPANTSYVDATLTVDGGFATVGNVEAPGAGLPAVFLYGFGPDGTLLWQHPLASWITKLAADSVLGGFWTVTYKAEAGTLKAIASRLDAVGKPLWSATVGADSTSALSLYEAAGGIVVLGSRKAAAAGYSSPWAAGLDGAGNLLWETTVDMGLPGQFGGGVVLGDGTHIWGGGFGSGGSKQICLVRANSKGKLIWTKDLGDAGKDRFAQAMVLADSGASVVLAGDGFILQVDGSGTVQWQNIKALAGVARLLRRPGLGTLAYGSAPWASAFDPNGNFAGQFSIAATPTPALSGLMPASDGLFAVGTVVTAKKELRGWVARADAWGQTSCGPSGKCADTEPGACDDKNPCTKDVCSGPNQGCTHSPFLDGTPCTAGKTCKSGNCI